MMLQAFVIYRSLIVRFCGRGISIGLLDAGGGGGYTYKSNGGPASDASNQGTIGDNFLTEKRVIG